MKADDNSQSSADKAPGAKSGMLIRDMVADERPREKAMRLGIKALSNTELMAIIFATGVAGKSVIELSNEILASAGGHLSKVARLSVAEFRRQFKGIGTAKAIALLAALELGARSAADAQTVDDPAIRSARDVYNLMRHHLERLPHEEFWVIYLSQAGRVIREVNISRGGLASTVVDPKIIMRGALESYAAALILVHNHPSGSLKPSLQDDNLTKKIVDAAALFDIRVNDHLIVTDAGYYSYCDEGRMPH